MQTLGIENVSVHFGGLKAIESVSEKLNRSEIVGLIGPNGAGKTTMINVMTGFQTPTSGQVNLDGEEISSLPPHEVSRVGVSRTFQAGRLYKSLSVRDNVEAAALNAGHDKRATRKNVLEILDWMDLGDKANMLAGYLPYTDERRVGIARAMVRDPHFVLLDEPAAGMSDIECDDIMKIITEIPERFGAGVMLVEHNMRVVMSVCSRIHVLDSGRTLSCGTPEEIQRDPAVKKAYLGHG